MINPNHIQHSYESVCLALAPHSTFQVKGKLLAANCNLIITIALQIKETLQQSGRKSHPTAQINSQEWHNIKRICVYDFGVNHEVLKPCKSHLNGHTE